MAMRLALDTNRYTDLCRDVLEVVTLVEHADAVFLPFAVLGEVRAGFSLGKRGAENERVLRQFLMKPGVAVLFADDQTTHHYAALFRQLKRQERRFRPTTCGPLRWCCNTISSFAIATTTSIIYPRSRGFEQETRGTRSAAPGACEA
jgi:predicted nucleic acid-binding protein